MSSSKSDLPFNYEQSFDDDNLPGVNFNDNNASSLNLPRTDSLPQRQNLDTEEDFPGSEHIYQSGQLSRAHNVHDVPIYSLPRTLHDAANRSPGSTSPFRSASVINGPLSSPMPRVDVEIFDVNATLFQASQLGVSNSERNLSEEGEKQHAIDDSNVDRPDLCNLLSPFKTTIPHHRQISAHNQFANVTDSTESNTGCRTEGPRPNPKNDVSSAFMIRVQQKNRKCSASWPGDKQDADSAERGNSASGTKRARATAKDEGGKCCSVPRKRTGHNSGENPM